NVVEDVAIVGGCRVGDVDDIDGGESLLRLGLRGLDHGRRFVDVDRFLDFLQMVKSNFDFGSGSGFDRGVRSVVALLLDMDLVQTGGNVREFAPAGNFGLAPESLGWRWRLESDAGAGNGNSVFIEHGDGKAARSLLAMREQHQKSEHRG